MIAGAGVWNRWRFSVCTGCWIWLVLWAMPLVGAAPPEAEPAVQEEETERANADTKRLPIDAGRMKWIRQALVMLLGIILSGIFLLVLAALWGSRARRLARKPLPSVSKPNELWFLKPKPNPEGGDDPGENSSDANVKQ